MKAYNALRKCVQETKWKDMFQIYHEGISIGHRGVNGSLD